MTIVSTPGTLGGRPRIDGRRIGVHHVVGWARAGMTMEEIGRDFDLSPSQIAEALLYYCLNTEEIDAIIAHEMRYVALYLGD